MSRNGHVYPKPYTDSGWRLELGQRRTLDLPGMLEELRQQIEPAADRIAEQVTANEVEVELSMHIYMSEQTPIGTIPASIVALAARLGATLDLDLYVVNPD